MSKLGTAFGLIILGMLGLSLISSNDENSAYSSESYYPTASETVIDRDEAIEEHWDEIREYLTGTETIDACSSESGNCYSLDADIYSGQVDQIYFDNGGYLYFGAYIDDNGDASEFDYNGNEWNFALDMDSSLVDDAVQEWADDNGYEIE